MTHQIADLMDEELEAKGVVVVLEATHTCMTIRGVRKAGQPHRHQRRSWAVQDQSVEPCRSDGADYQQQVGGQRRTKPRPAPPNPMQDAIAFFAALDRRNRSDAARNAPPQCHHAFFRILLLVCLGLGVVAALTTSAAGPGRSLFSRRRFHRFGALAAGTPAGGTIALCGHCGWR